MSSADLRIGERSLRLLIWASAAFVAVGSSITIALERVVMRLGFTVEVMRILGFTEVYEPQGGVTWWAEAGLPVIPGRRCRSVARTARTRR